MYELVCSGRWFGGNIFYGFNSEKIIFLDENLKERSMYKF